VEEKLANFATPGNALVSSLPFVNLSKATVMTQNDWILDVLADLRTFARANALNALAEQLDDTTLVAAAELSSRANEAYAHYDGDEGQAEQAARRVGGDHHP
jgi:hypothetical protein